MTNYGNITPQMAKWAMDEIMEQATTVFPLSPPDEFVGPRRRYDPLDGQSPARAAGRYIAKYIDDWENEEAVAIMQGLLKQILGY